MSYHNSSTVTQFFLKEVDKWSRQFSPKLWKVMKMVPCVILYYNFHPSNRLCKRVIYIQAELFLCRTRNIKYRKSFPVTASPQNDMSLLELFGFSSVFTDFRLIWICRHYFYRKKKEGLKSEGCGFPALLTAPVLQ